jgi:hypothetical protein
VLQLGKESKVSVGPKTWTVSRLTVGVIESFRDWVAQQEGDPFENLPDRFLDRLPPEEVSRLLKEAKDVKDQLKGFSLACPLAQKWIKNERGGAYLVALLLQQHQPGATADDALAVMEAVGLEKVIADAHGTVPKESAGNAPGPLERAPL